MKTWIECRWREKTFQIVLTSLIGLISDEEEEEEEEEESDASIDQRERERCVRWTVWREWECHFKDSSVYKYNKPFDICDRVSYKSFPVQWTSSTKLSTVSDRQHWQDLNVDLLSQLFLPPPLSFPSPSSSPPSSSAVGREDSLQEQKRIVMTTKINRRSVT